MKRIIKSTLLSLVVAFGLGGVVAAADCSISNTGTGSTNTCTISENYTVSITCTNGVQASFNNSQTATSGAATANGNSIVSNVSSGSVDNAATFANELALYCAAAPVVATTTTPTTPQVAGAATTTTPTVAALPKTGPTELASTIAISALAVAGMAIAAQTAVNAYRRNALK